MSVFSLLVSLIKVPVFSFSDCFILEECTLSSIDVSEKVSELRKEPKLTKIRISQGSVPTIYVLRYMSQHKLKSL